MGFYTAPEKSTSRVYMLEVTLNGIDLSPQKSNTWLPNIDIYSSKLFVKLTELSRELGNNIQKAYSMGFEYQPLSNSGICTISRSVTLPISRKFEWSTFSLKDSMKSVFLRLCESKHGVVKKISNTEQKIIITGAWMPSFNNMLGHALYHLKNDMEKLLDNQQLMMGQKEFCFKILTNLNEKISKIPRPLPISSGEDDCKDCKASSSQDNSNCFSTCSLN